MSAAAPLELGTLALNGTADVVSARQAARALAELLGFERQDQTRLATAVSEIARNAVAHAGGGELRFAVDATRPQWLQVTVADRGPGIAALDAVLRGERSFAPGFGTGLNSARRLVDRFEVDSDAGRGTRVRLGQQLPRAAAARLDAEALRRIEGQLKLRAAPAAPLDALVEQNRELMRSLDELRERQDETERLNRELEETNRGVVALYAELEDKAEQLRSASELKSRFLSHMSHEFRTPLNSILALARLLADRVDGTLTGEQERQVEYIRRSADDLLELVNDLLDLAKVEAGKLEVKPEVFTVADLFGALRGSLKPLQLNPSVELVFEPVDGVPEMRSDASKVAQVLRNFVSNALKFTERGEVRVRAEHLPDHGALRFSVADTGIGIAPEHCALLFEEFAQIDGRLQRGGTGLGLSLSRRLATLLGGEVAVQSEVGRGSVFTLTVPLRWGETAALPCRTGQPLVLVVDDEEAFRYVIHHIARDAGCDVLEAPDGRAGLQLAREQTPDVIVLDLHMPGLDGYAMLEALAGDARLRRTPVIICTSTALGLEQKRALSAAHAIVPKHELSRDGLTALIRSLLVQARRAA